MTYLKFETSQAGASRALSNVPRANPRAMLFRLVKRSARLGGRAARVAYIAGRSLATPQALHPSCAWRRADPDEVGDCANSKLATDLDGALQHLSRMQQESKPARSRKRRCSSG